MDLAIYDQTVQGLSDDQVDLVKKILQFAGEYLKLPDTTEMSVTFVNNNKIRSINKEYRDLDKSTDVISFALEDEDEDIPIIMDSEMMDKMPKNIGDIFISVDKVKEQADFLEHSFERELAFLVIHGFLHLNDYDHMRSVEDEKVMFRLQREILDDFGLKR